MRQNQKLPNEVTKAYSDLASKPPMAGIMGGNFVPILSAPPNFKYSGYKFHVFAESKEDVVEVLQCIGEIVKDKGCEMKCATSQFFNGSKAPDNPQHGKGVTIYLPFDMVNSGADLGFQQSLIDLLRNYNKRGTVNGDTKLSDNLYQRWELSIEWPEVKKMGGLSQAEYKKYYKKSAE